MSVTYINTPTKRKPSFSESLSNVVGQGLEAYGKYQKQNRLKEALQNVESSYGDQNLSEQQRLLKAYRELQEFPDVAQQLTSSLSRAGETPLQRAQREKIDLENKQLMDEDSYYNQLMGGQKKSPYEPTHMVQGNELGMAGEDAQEERPSRGRAAAKEFDYNDPNSWSDKQIDQFRAIESKSPKAKTLARKAQNEWDRRQETKKAKTKYKENVTPLNSALDAIDTMENLGKKGNLGVGSKALGYIYPQTRKDRAEYERLGKSLISYASNIPIRNKQEFETLAHDLYDPSNSDATRAGILSAMKRIIQSSMEAYENPEEEGAPSSKKANQERPPLTSFLR